MHRTSFVLLILACAVSARTTRGESLRISEDGTSTATIVVSAAASDVEKTAANELASFLQQVTGGVFEPEETIPKRSDVIAVGPDAVRELRPNLDLSQDALGHEGFVILSDERCLVLTGAKGSRRGTLYAVYTFLTDVVGCRWWAPGATTIPRRRTLDVPQIDRREKPAFEYRESFISHTVDAEWAVRNRVNGHFYSIPQRLGGHVAYRGYQGGWGFVHTFDTLVPPKEFFKQHPEWFSEIDGKRVGPPGRSQWCLTNADLLEFVKKRVHEMLSQSPPDAIVEISQNDWHSRCQCADCLAVEKEEGSPSGPLLRFLNAVAEYIEADFPEAVVGTLAYQYTRTPPKRVRPRPNVCIRLCSIECSFLQPLEHEANEKFVEDIRRWSELTDRLYVWDYVTNFSLPLQPHPNLRVLAPNVRLFRAHGVKGVFEEGAHYTLGAAFSEIRAWVLARLLWDPDLDGDALVREFVSGYYGPAASHIQAYIDRLHDTAEATGSYMTCFDRKGEFLTFEFLTSADQLLTRAEETVADDPALLKRVEMMHASVWYAIISRWAILKQEQLAGRIEEWFPRSRAEYCTDYVRACREHKVNPSHIEPWEVMKERRKATVPDLVAGLPRDQWFDLQDDLFSLHRAGTWATPAVDEAASDGVASRMPATHYQWATQCVLSGNMIGNGDGWDTYVGIRVERVGGGSGTAFQAGIYDAEAKRSLGTTVVTLDDAAPSDEYRLYCIPGKLSPDAYIWVAPAENPDLVRAVWVDRILLVKRSQP